jgi:DNA primase
LNRGVKIQTIKRFGIGYSSNSRSDLVFFLMNFGFSAKEIIAANLGICSRDGDMFNRFVSRIMFPIIDLKGNVLGFGGRNLKQTEPKYLNTSDTPVFKKSMNLFAVNFAKNNLKNGLILTEGYMDAIALHQIGFENAVAGLGTAFTYDQAKLISKYSQKVYISYDSDNAGKKAAERTSKILREFGVSVKIIKILGAKDPDEFVKIHGNEAHFKFKNLLENSKNDIKYRISEIESSVDSTEEKVSYLSGAAEILAEVSNPIERDVYISEICSKTGIGREAMNSYIKKIISKKIKTKKSNDFKLAKLSILKEKDEINTEKNTNLRASYIEESLISYIIRNGKLNHKILDLKPCDFVTDFNRKIFEKILKLSEENKSIEIGIISEDMDFKQKGKISKIVNSSMLADENEVANYVNELKNEKDFKNFKESKSTDFDVLNFLGRLRSSRL